MTTDTTDLAYLRRRLLPLQQTTVALVFTGRGWELAPFDDTTVAKWACCPHSYAFSQRGLHVDAWFEIHRPEIWGEKKAWHPDYNQWRRELGEPLVMLFPDPDAPSAIPYPQSAVKAMVPPDSPIGGTMDWMLACALLLGVPRVDMYGCAYETFHEEVHQKPSILYWIGLARGRGMIINVMGGRLLLNALDGNYGPDYPPWPEGTHPRQYPTRPVRYLRFGPPPPRKEDVCPN